MSEDIQSAVTKLAAYALRTGLIAQEDIIYAVNCIIRELKLEFYTGSEAEITNCSEKLLQEQIDDGICLESILRILNDYACAEG